MSETAYVQSVPEISSTERMHVLDETCWCKPELVEITTMEDSTKRVLVAHRDLDVPA